MKASRPPLYLVAKASRAPQRRQRAAPTPRLQQQLAGAFEQAAIGMALLGTDHACRQVNQAFCDMLGYPREELLTKTYYDISPAEDVQEDLRLRRRMLAGELDSYQREKRYLHKSGRVLWGHFTCSLMCDEAGEPAYFITQAQDITERKLAEQALRESEERFRSLAMLSSDWYWEQDTQFRYTSFSGRDLLRPWRAVQHQAIGRRVWELEGTDPADPSWRLHRAVLAAQQPFREFEYLRVIDGQPHYFAISGEPVVDAGGVFTGYRGTARDVTQDRVAQQRLRDAQAMLHVAAQIGRFGAWALDPASQRMTWSEEVCAIHDVGRTFAPGLEQAIGFYAPEWRTPIRDAFDACLHDGAPFDVEAQVITAAGRRIWVRTIGEAEWDAQGRVRSLRGACQDISESKEAAEHARLLADRLSTTLESLTDAFFTVDRDWRFTYVNAEAERMLRRGRSELLGRSLKEAYPNLRGSALLARSEQAMDSGSTAQFEEYHEPLGIWMQIKAYPSRQGLAIYMKDVSERVAARREILRLNAELEARVRQRTAQLEQANKELEAFSYSIAHDLRAPLGSIDGFTQVLEQSAAHLLDGKSQHYLQRVRRCVRQMGELTDGLLALANLSRASLRSEPVDLAPMVHAAAAACRERWPAAPVEWFVEPSLPVQGDPRLLSQVIGNLVSNAWKFSAGVAQPRIEVGCLQDPARGRVHYVRDNGAGFDMAHAGRMFEAFQRMHTAAEFEGTGIGLAIVHKIIVRHGGAIWAESAPRQGAAFYFTLPAPTAATPAGLVASAGA